MPPTVWVLKAGGGGHLAEEFRQAGTAALSFSPLNESGDDFAAASLVEIQQQLESYTEYRGTNKARAARALHAFINTMEIGSLVLTPRPDGHVQIGRITGSYRFQADPVVGTRGGGGRFPHTRACDWADATLPRSELPEETRRMLGQQTWGSLYAPPDQNALLELTESVLGGRRQPHASSDSAAARTWAGSRLRGDAPRSRARGAASPGGGAGAVKRSVGAAMRGTRRQTRLARGL